MDVDSFHFLRPYWLLMLGPLVVLITLCARRARTSGRSGWHNVVDPHLLEHLVVTSADNKRCGWHLTALTAGLFASILALAGPTWQRIEMPVFKSQEPSVLVLSLAQSMNATDLSPDRLTRAGHKVRDLLGAGQGGDFGFIVYSDWPFVAAPLTSDTRVITQMLLELSTSLMPVFGNRLELAIAKAKDLLQQAHARHGRIIVIADNAGQNPAESIAAARVANEAGYRVSVLGVGTSQGANLQTASGVSVKTRAGQQAITRLAVADLANVAAAGGGIFITVSADSADIDALARNSATVAAQALRMGSQFRADAWNDMGYWLLIVPVLLAPLAFRKNILMVLPIAITISLSATVPDASAASWEELWKSPDQRGAQAYQSGEFSQAAAAFQNPRWKASAMYKAGQYAEAATIYADAASANDYYNLGNALAKAGELEQAIAAYDEALQQEPLHGDAKFNRELVTKLLQEQQRREQEKDKARDKTQDKRQQDGGQQEQGDNEEERAGDQQKSAGGQQQRGDPQDESHTASVEDARQDGGKGQLDAAPGDNADSKPAAADDGGRSAFRQAMDALLRGNGDDEPAVENQQPAQASSSSGLSELDQAREQKLRAVPDDLSGLLRARIRQHYARQLRNR